MSMKLETWLAYYSKHRCKQYQIWNGKIVKDPTFHVFQFFMKFLDLFLNEFIYRVN